jgi:hypothetical protein
MENYVNDMDLSLSLDRSLNNLNALAADWKLLSFCGS